ncbi:MAG: hypothetical protein HY928_06730 [Elusimicrobia bacterium]|nr:hypothetical protein [Elusimicrobiota bacterium]
MDWYLANRDRGEFLTAGTMRYPLPNGLAPGAFVEAVKSVMAWERIFKERCAGFVGGAAWRAVEEARAASLGVEQIALWRTGEHPGADRIGTMMDAFARLAGLDPDEAFPGERRLPSGPYFASLGALDPVSFCQVRFYLGWTDAEGRRQEPPFPFGGAPDRARIRELVLADRPRRFLPAAAGPACGPDPLAAIVGDAVAEAAADPGAPGLDRDPAFLADVLRTSAETSGAVQECAALLCSLEFRDDWHREAAPHAPRFRIPLLFAMLRRRVADGRGAGALRRALRVAGRRDGGGPAAGWLFPEPDGTFPALPGRADRWCFAPSRFWVPLEGQDADTEADQAADGFQTRTDMAERILADERYEALALETALHWRVSLFSRAEGETTDRAVAEKSARAVVAGWLAAKPGADPHAVPAEADLLLRRLAGTDLDPRAVERFVHLIDATPLGDAMAARFAEPGSLAAALPAGYVGSLRGGVVLGLLQGSLIDVPRARALVFLLGDRQGDAAVAAERWGRETGRERWERMRRNLDGAHDLRARMTKKADAPRRRK